jgi:hypothetical protein
MAREKKCLQFELFDPDYLFLKECRELSQAELPVNILRQALHQAVLRAAFHGARHIDKTLHYAYSLRAFHDILTRDLFLNKN